MVYHIANAGLLCESQAQSSPMKFWIKHCKIRFICFFSASCNQDGKYRYRLKHQLCTYKDTICNSGKVLTSNDHESNKDRGLWPVGTVRQVALFHHFKHVFDSPYVWDRALVCIVTNLLFRNNLSSNDQLSAKIRKARKLQNYSFRNRLQKIVMAKSRTRLGTFHTPPLHTQSIPFESAQGSSSYHIGIDVVG